MRPVGLARTISADDAELAEAAAIGVGGTGRVAGGGGGDTGEVGFIEGVAAPAGSGEPRSRAS